MNRVNKLFVEKDKRVLNIYTTAGYPQLDSTVEVVLALEKSGADLIELGMPYSDPMADGETIQESSAVALKNGITLDKIFDQVKTIRETSQVPIILMGYLNQIMQYGKEKFVNRCKEVGVDGLIIPDIPMAVFEEEYKNILLENNIGFSFLVTPQTSDSRLVQADSLSTSFLYVVSRSSITGSSQDISQSQVNYFERLGKMKLNAPRLIGFGIHDKATFDTACTNANGAIIGSAFIRALKGKPSEQVATTVENFVSAIIQ